MRGCQYFRCISPPHAGAKDEPCMATIWLKCQMARGATHALQLVRHGSVAMTKEEAASGVAEKKTKRVIMVAVNDKDIFISIYIYMSIVSSWSSSVVRCRPLPCDPSIPFFIRRPSSVVSRPSDVARRPSSARSVFLLVFCWPSFKSNHRRVLWPFFVKFAYPQTDGAPPILYHVIVYK